MKVVEEMNKRLQQGSLSFKPINLTINMGKRDDLTINMGKRDGCWGGHPLQEIPSLLNAYSSYHIIMWSHTPPTNFISSI